MILLLLLFLLLFLWRGGGEGCANLIFNGENTADLIFIEYRFDIVMCLDTFELFQTWYGAKHY